MSKGNSSLRFPAESLISLWVGVISGCRPIGPIDDSDFKRAGL